MKYLFLFGYTKDSSCHAFSVCRNTYTGLVDLGTSLFAIGLFMAACVIVHKWLQMLGCGDERYCEECCSCIGTCVGPCSCTEVKCDNCSMCENKRRAGHQEMATNTKGRFTLKEKRVKVTRSDEDMLESDIYAVRHPNDCYNCYWQLMTNDDERSVADALGRISYRSIGKNNVATMMNLCPPFLIRETRSKRRNHVG